MDGVLKVAIVPENVLSLDKDQLPFEYVVSPNSVTPFVNKSPLGKTTKL